MRVGTREEGRRGVRETGQEPGAIPSHGPENLGPLIGASGEVDGAMIDRLWTASPSQNGEFGERLRRLRESRRLSVRRLARLVAVSPSYLSRIERNQCEYPGARDGERGEERKRQPGNHPSRSTTQGPDQQALEEKLADNLRRCGAERKPDRNFTTSAR